MKVGTDGVLLGAWTALYSAKKILDIGTGTGLVALMLAQRGSDALLDAVEIEPEAGKQAAENVAKSPYASRISVYCSSLAEFAQGREKGYDLLVCNPPFFIDSMKAEGAERSLARHSEELNLDTLTELGDALLGDDGSLSIILPFEQESQATKLAAFHNLFLQRRMHIFPIPGKIAKRVCMQFGRARSKVEHTELVIEANGRHSYSEAYIDLTKEFYLDF